MEHRMDVHTKKLIHIQRMCDILQKTHLINKQTVLFTLSQAHNILILKICLILKNTLNQTWDVANLCIRNNMLHYHGTTASNLLNLALNTFMRVPPSGQRAIMVFLDPIIRIVKHRSSPTHSFKYLVNPCLHQRIPPSINICSQARQSNCSNIRCIERSGRKDRLSFRLRILSNLKDREFNNIALLVQTSHQSPVLRTHLEGEEATQTLIEESQRKLDRKARDQQEMKTKAHKEPYMKEREWSLDKQEREKQLE